MGSFTTINRVLTTVLLSQRQTHATQISERSPQSMRRFSGKPAGKIELIERNSRKQIDAANHARAEAALEIERLERKAEQAAETLAAAQRATQEATYPS